MNGEARRGRDRKMVVRWQEKRVETVRQVRYLGVNIYERMAFEGHYNAYATRVVRLCVVLGAALA